MSDDRKQLPRRMHLVGAGGVGMAGLAVLLKAQGHEVSGCDLVASARTRWLEAQGIPVLIGHHASHVAGMDELIVTPAVRADNPELLAAGGIRVRFRGEVLAELVNGRDAIAVCGSHGKTTTATFTARLLKALGEDVAWCIGGETGAWPVAGAGKGPLVVEADESDGTLANYRARVLVVNRCDYDHPDHFRTEAEYLACFDAARAQAGEVIESEALDDGSALFHGTPAAAAFAALAPHNRRNARAAVEVARRRGHPVAAIAAALPEVVAELPDRRFQTVWPIVGAASDVRVVTDYAHHPVEMACAVAMARAACRGRLIVLFQPHRPSRTKALKEAFPAAFAAADETVLCPTYAAFERPIEGGDVADLYAACRAAGVKGLKLARSCAEAWEHARRSMGPGDLTLLLGAGDIISLVPRVRADLGSLLPVSEPPRFWIGMGTNTWRSDLAGSGEYVKTQGPAGQPGARLLEDPNIGPGIAWMAGIPGTVGGWVRMNAGAFGHSISEAVESVKVDGVWRPAAECGFGYRTSSIEGEIQDVRWRSLKADPFGPAYYLARRRKFPAGTWGSVFKNPPGDFAGRLLEACGSKGMRVGGAYVWEGHANVIVAGADATPGDVLALARLMRLRVSLRLGVTLEFEVRGLE